MYKLIEYFYKLIKKREFTLDPNISLSYLFGVIYSNFINLMRGYIIKRKLVFIGHRVNIICKDKLYLSDGVKIDDFTLIDSLSSEGVSIGSSCSIGRFCQIRASGTLTSIGKGIKLGDNVGIGDFAHIGGAGGVFIGDDTIAGAYLSIHPENHVFSSANTLIRKQGVTRKGVHIGSNCWIGAKVTILDGTDVGDGCVIAAGAVVRGTFPNNVLIGGVPARILKERCDEKSK